MSRNYDSNLRYAKDAMTKSILDAQAKKCDMTEIARAVDELNKAWDELTDCLVRQRKERDDLIRSLVDDLAESRKG